MTLIRTLCSILGFACFFFQIGHLKKGLNPPSLSELAFGSPYLTTAIKTGIITGVIALAVSILFLLISSMDGYDGAMS